MNRLIMIIFAIAILTVGALMPSESDARNNTCLIKATKDVDLQAHHLTERGGEFKGPRRKSDVIWSGYLERGDYREIRVNRGKVLVTYQDLTKDRARPANRAVNCQNGNTILVPR